MSRLVLDEISTTDTALEDIRAMALRRMEADTLSTCPLDYTVAVLKLFASQSCGKCVPCRVGITEMTYLIDRILDGEGTEGDLDLLKKTATTVYTTSDCVIGAEAGRMMLTGLSLYQDEYEHHLKQGRCKGSFRSIPCTTFCPAHVDIPAYISLVKAQRYEDALRVIRNTNPFPSVCAFICEHPCESVCRRGMVDAPVNIRALKRAAVDNAGQPVLPSPYEATGKQVAIVGGGPSGLTAAYYLALMGHKVTVFEQHSKLGGMLRYGIPRYRLPAKNLDYDIDTILSLGIEVRLNTKVGTEISYEALEDAYDSLFVAIGAHQGKNLGIEGEDQEGIISAIDFLGAVEEGSPPDLAGKRVVIIGGGNVAMDASRTARRLNAASVACVYRRRKEDMTALVEEVDAACEEGCDLITLKAPLRIEKEGNHLNLIVQSQMAGEYSRGRPQPQGIAQAEEAIACDLIISAIGQAIEFEVFEAAGLAVNRGTFRYEVTTLSPGCSQTFVGGDCATGPATVIKAIEAGRVAAANIDEMLGYHHTMGEEIEIPSAEVKTITPTGRANISERPATSRIKDFSGVEIPLCPEEVCQEAGRCLRCDHYGLGAFDGRGVSQW